MNSDLQSRMIVVGGHTRSIGKTQLICDIISAFPQAGWIAGKITQYGHGICTRNGKECDCAPDHHTSSIDWETHPESGTDSARFLAAGARRSFWLRTRQGQLAEGLPLLDAALRESAAENSTAQDSTPSPIIIESNSLMKFVEPALYFSVVDSSKQDFKPSARAALDRASAIVFREPSGGLAPAQPFWLQLPPQLLREKPSVLQREGEPLPEPLAVLVQRFLDPSLRLAVPADSK